MSKQLEPELVLYGRLDNFDALKSALSVERHEQYEIKVQTEPNEPRKRIRVRKVTANGRDTYELTSKQGDPAPIEETRQTSNEVFEMFRALQPVGMYKDRYQFPYGKFGGRDLYWEIDVFIDRATGQYYPWVKVDLEFPTAVVDGQYVALVPAEINPLPLRLHDLMNNLQDDPEMRKRIRSLYDTYFMTRAIT